MHELWKPVFDYDGIYSVFNYGNIRNNKTGKILKPVKNSCGYPQIFLYKQGFMKTITIHKLVINHFFGPCPEGLQINHKDTNKENNFIENLEYVTPKINMNHGFRNGLWKSRKGISNTRAKLTEKEIVDIRNNYPHDGINHKTLAKIYQVSPSTIGRILKRTIWQHI